MTGLADPAELARRHAMRDAPHLAPLQPYLAALRARHGLVPDPDPLDGGAAARLLLLLETPGPRIRDTGIVSRDNPTGTGRNLRALLAPVARHDTLIWNAVPWVIHDPGALNRAPRRAEIRAGLGELPALLALMPHLRVVLLSGRVAAEAAPLLRAAHPNCLVIAMPHPSPTIQCTSPAVRARSREAVAEAAAILAGGRMGEAA